MQGEFAISQAAASEHLRVLRDRGFASVSIHGARRIYAFGRAPVAGSRCLARAVPPVPGTEARSACQGDFKGRAELRSKMLGFTPAPGLGPTPTSTESTATKSPGWRLGNGVAAFAVRCSRVTWERRRSRGPDFRPGKGNYTRPGRIWFPFRRKKGKSGAVGPNGFRLSP